jgi:Uma2 family endonuclease
MGLALTPYNVRGVGKAMPLGVRDVWLVEPTPRRVIVHRAGEERQVLHESDALDGGSLLPGFRYSLARLFSSEI